MDPNAGSNPDGTGEPAPSAPRGSGRRKILMGAAVAGLGALIAAEAARSAGKPLPAAATVSTAASTVGSTVQGTVGQAVGAALGTTPVGSSLTDDQKLRHLLRRAGFGASPSELTDYQKLGLSGTIDRLINYETVDNSALEQRLNGLNLDLTKLPDLQRWWMLRMIYSARPLEERMTYFWHGHLTSAISKVGRPAPMLVQNNLFRANALGRFPDLLKAVSKDPAMMVWLDTQTNRKGHANENYARELMELFALGIGNYTEQDVREGARAFTGWALRGNFKMGEVTSFFNPRQHDDGTKTFLGHTGNFNGDDVVDIIVQQPASAHFIARKLFGFLAYPNPTDQVLAPLVDAYTKSGYSIKALVRAILTSDAFFAPQAYRVLVKSPVELIAGTARGLGVETNAVGLPGLATLMGQTLFNPPNVAGWPGGPAWLSSGTWLARLNFANRVVAAVEAPKPAVAAKPGVVSQLLHPNNPAQPTFSGAALDVKPDAAPGEFADAVVGLLLDGQINPDQRQVLVDYLTPPNGGAASPAWHDERRRGAIYLAMAMPEFHLG
jgi:uncharacterized protein (DUF1800 family)